MQADSPSELDLASIDTVLSTARSVRRRLDFHRPVEQATILDCIDIATQAPTGLGGESWRFVVVLDAYRKRRLAELYRTVLLELAEERGLVIKPTQQALVARLHEIPAMILVCTTTPAPAGEVAAQVAYYGSILPAAWSLMLALRARQLGATWTTLLSSRQKEVGRILEMPDDAVLTVMLPVAYTKNARLNRAERVPARQVTFWDTWGNES